jgi:hypothetical protein
MEVVVWGLWEARIAGHLEEVPDGALAEVDGPVAVLGAGPLPQPVELAVTTEVFILALQVMLMRWHTQHKYPRKSVSKCRLFTYMSSWLHDGL